MVEEGSQQREATGSMGSTEKRVFGSSLQGDRRGITEEDIGGQSKMVTCSCSKAENPFI